jgi:lipopolysaccharide transport system ATP-binding protein
MKPIIFDNVSKVYRLKGRKPTLSEILSNVAHTLRGDRKLRRSQIFALRNISFEVERGEVLGVIGPNGSGKTTILSLIAGVIRPTSGQIRIHGRIAPLIALGAGFHPELTGRENIYLNGIIMGMKKEEIKRKFDAIVDFAELEEFLDTPVKRYSSGMYARLGFATAIHAEPDILLVDEVLAVGDLSFQDKCLKRMKEFRENGVSIVFVSHSLEMVRRICDRVILVNKGEIRIDGTPERTIAGYFDAMVGTKIDTGNKAAEIIAIELYNGQGLATTTFQSGDSAEARVRVRFNQDVNAPEIGFFIHRHDSLLVMSTGSRDLGAKLPIFHAGDVLEAVFPFQVNLLNGIYHMGAEVRSGGFKKYLDQIVRAVTLQVHEDYAHGGLVHLHPRCIVKRVDM